MNIERFQKLRKEIDYKRRQVDQSQGALDNILSQVEEEFGCRSLAEAESLLAKLQKEEKNLDKDIESDVKKMIEEYPDMEW